MIRGYQSFRLIPSSKLLCPMAFPPFSFYNLYEIFGPPHPFHSLFSVPVYRNVLFSFTFLSVTLSDVLVRFSLSLVPYSFPVKIYVLGGPYLLCLDFMIYIDRCYTVVPLFLNYRLISHPALSYSFIHIFWIFEFPLMAHWSIPPLSCFILQFCFWLRIQILSCPSILCSFVRFSFRIFFSAHWPLPLSYDFFFGLSFSVHRSVPLQSYFVLNFSLICPLDLTILVSVSFRFRFTISLDRTAFSFFFSVFMFLLYHLFYNCQYIF